jgi:hypothetical protein
VKEKGDSTLVVIGIEVLIKLRVTFLFDFSVSRKKDANRVDIAINTAKDKVATADNSEIPLLIKFN